MELEFRELDVSPGKTEVKQLEGKGVLTSVPSHGFFFCILKTHYIQAIKMYLSN